jgi:hypothetical protein
VVVINNCDGVAGTSGEFYGNLYVTKPGDATPTSLYNCSNCCQVNDAGECAKNVSTSFTLHEGQSWGTSSDQWLEDDGDCGPACADDNVGSFTQNYSYPTTPTSGTYNLTGGDRCIDIKYSIVSQ